MTYCKPHNGINTPKFYGTMICDEKRRVVTENNVCVDSVDRKRIKIGEV